MRVPPAWAGSYGRTSLSLPTEALPLGTADALLAAAPELPLGDGLDPDEQAARAPTARSDTPTVAILCKRIDVLRKLGIQWQLSNLEHAITGMGARVDLVK
ncbi:MAG: hypothetical protein WCP26_03190 [Actinomycetes bacterium]